MIVKNPTQQVIGRIDLDQKPTQLGKSATIIPIDKATADDILERAPFPNQRTVDEPTVQILRRDMSLGLFRISTIHLMFAIETGLWYLVNGQHRMWSVSRAGLPIDFDVITEIVDKYADVERAYLDHDRGRIRSASQLINALGPVSDDLNGTQFKKVHTAAGALLVGFNQRSAVTRALDDFDRRLTLAMALTDQAARYFAAVANRPKLRVMRAFDTTDMIAIGVMTFVGLPDRAEQFWTDVTIGAEDKLALDAPERAIVDQVLERELPAYLMIRQVAACWNAAVDGRPTPKMTARLMGAPLSIRGTGFDGTEPKRVTIINDVVTVVPFGYDGDK